MSEAQRPNPDDLLSQLHPAGSDKRSGKLKVFFGAAPGVGKTYAMLEDARKQAMEGREILIGYAEPHIRPETEMLLMGLDILPPMQVEYRGTVFKEFDLDAALTCGPRLICIDELAHTNAPGMRHAKRWQDVFELLDGGFDVYTTLNVQHLESVNDVVERITGVKVQETLPDEVLDRAEEIELIDTTPEELTQRLRDGKVYRPDVAERAIRQFFNKGNLTALRELALRRTAERVDAQMREQRQKASIRQTWAASERLLVCVGPSPLSSRLIRSARRLATSLRSPWTAAFVETPASASMSAASRDRVNAHLQLAQQLGAEVVTLSGESVSQVLTDYARDRNVTKIVVGKPDMPRWRERLFGSLVDDLIRKSGDMDVYVIRGEPGKVATPLVQPKARASAWGGVLAAVIVTLAATAIGWILHRVVKLSDTNVLMVYLLGVLFVSWRYSRRASFVAVLLGVFTFDFFFVKPYLSFAVSDQEYIITFVVMLLTGMLISSLVQRTRDQAELFRRRQVTTQAVLDFTAELSEASDVDGFSQITASRIGRSLECDCTVRLRDDASGLRSAGRHGSAFADDPKEDAVARWVLEHGESAGAGTATLPMAAGLYLPIFSSDQHTIGVVAIRRANATVPASSDDRRLIDSLVLQAANAIERATLSSKSRDAWQRVEQENLRNTLLASVSHDLRTPLAAITGAASAMVEPGIVLPDCARAELAGTILSESRRMERVISNLLDITQFESGETPLHVQPTNLNELVSAVVTRLRSRLDGCSVVIHQANDLVDVPCDASLIDQVVSNLLENAIDHGSATSPIEIDITQEPKTVSVSMSDRGPGIPPGTEKRVFEKFVRLNPATDRRGLGLGLAICKAIVESHKVGSQKGAIEAFNRDGGGATFRFSLPRSSISGKE